MERKIRGKNLTKKYTAKYLELKERHFKFKGANEILALWILKGISYLEYVKF